MVALGLLGVKIRLAALDFADPKKDTGDSLPRLCSSGVVGDRSVQGVFHS